MLVLKCIRAFSQMRNLLNIFSLRHIWPFLSGYIVEVLFQKFWGRLQKLQLLICMIWFGIFLKIWTFSKQFKKPRNFRRSQRLYSKDLFINYLHRRNPWTRNFKIYPMLSAPRKCKLTSVSRARPPTAYFTTQLSRRSTLEIDCWCGGMNCWTSWNSKRSIKPKTRTRRLSGLMNSFLRTLVVVFVSRKETMQRERYIQKSPAPRA